MQNKLIQTKIKHYLYKKRRKFKRKVKADPKQNKPPLKFIVVYFGTNQGCGMESNKGCPNIKSKKYSDLFFNQRFLQQSSSSSIESEKKICTQGMV